MSGGDSGAGSARQGVAQFMGIEVPDIYKQELQLQNPEYFGDFQAQMENTFSADPTAMAGISTDPRLADAQMAALGQLSEMGETGLLPGEQAALRGARRESAGMAEAKNQQIIDDMARRGMGGSGAELAARLQNSQSGADRASQESDRLVQMAQERALNAVGQSAGLAGNIRQQDFGEQADIARAKDSINAFNVQNSQATQARNVASSNQAAARNLSEQQRISEGKANTQNQQQQHNKGLYQQQFNNQMSRAGGISGAYQGVAQAEASRDANTANQNAAIIGGASRMGVGAMEFSDENAKTNIKSADLSNFLDKLSPYSYEYKDKTMGEGERLGVMAQDMEKTKPGQHLVKETSDGKVIDYSQAGGTIFAALSDLHKRIKEIEGKS